MGAARLLVILKANTSTAASNVTGSFRKILMCTHPVYKLQTLRETGRLHRFPLMPTWLPLSLTHATDWPMLWPGCCWLWGQCNRWGPRGWLQSWKLATDRGSESVFSRVLGFVSRLPRFAGRPLLVPRFPPGQRTAECSRSKHMSQPGSQGNCDHAHRCGNSPRDLDREPWPQGGERPVALSLLKH